MCVDLRIEISVDFCKNSIDVYTRSGLLRCQRSDEAISSFATESFIASDNWSDSSLYPNDLVAGLFASHSKKNKVERLELDQ